MKEKKKMGPVMTTVIASVLLLLACIIVGVGALANWIPSGGGKLPYGLLASIAIYGNAFIGDFSSKWSFGVLLVDAVVLVLFIVCTVKLIRKKQPKLIYCAFAASLGIAYLPFLGILAYRLMATGHAEVGAMWIIVISFLLDLAGILLMVIASLAAIKAKKEAEAELVVHEEALSEDQIRVIVREEIENYEAAKPVVKTLTKEDVNKIAEDVSNKVAKTVADETVAKALEKHVEDFHAQKEEAPVVEEAVEEPVAEEPAEEEIEAEAPKGENDPFAALRNKRRASFETRLKNADFDLRHKYYDLRDHIKSYGLSNRLSIPGDSFSAHRKRYVFITINGKHLKVYFAANPDDYKDTPIPVERTETKKYEDLPLQFKVRSDLSFRRAVKIVDDMLTKEGYTREDKPVKNTQNPQDK
ncbi:MAG: hypothetical protein PUI68_05805 [Mollicutes bacterium]|nr:hypothetical protein [Mollicutes bacterium]MDY6070986.1 hypothetical protein [Bacilli bacterium]